MSKNKNPLDKEFFTKSNQNLTIKQLLQIPREFRSFEHCKTIIEHVKDVKFLERYMETDEIYELAREFQLHTYEANAVVFKQGDPADCFYIILSGSVKVYLTAPSEVKHFSSLKEVTKLEKGDAFGELALHYNSVRSATIVTNEPTDFIVLDKDNFQKHIKTISTSHLGQIMEFYKDFPPFQSLSINDIAKYASKSLFYKFPSNTVVIREGDVPGEIFFIKAGRVKVIRRLNFKIHPLSRNLLLNDPNEPTPEDISRGLFKSMLIEIDELSHGDSFCDYAAFNKEPMHHSIVCSIPCELIALPLYDLNEINERTLSEYKNICKPYPDDTELRKTYLDLYRWNIWKKNLYQNVQIEKTNRRRGFNQQLREPFLKMVHMEKISIPVDTNMGLDLLEMSRLEKKKSPKYQQHNSSAVFSKNKLGLDNESMRSSKNDLLPRIPKSPNYKEGHSGYGNSSRDNSKSYQPKIRSFEFVVPQHRLAQADEEDEEEYQQEKGNESISKTNEFIKNAGYVPKSEVKAPYLYNLNDFPAGKVQIQEDPAKEEEGAASVLGTRAIANTFTKAFNSIGHDEFKLPSIRK